MSITSRQLFANNAVSTLAVELGISDTSLTVASGQGSLFPAPYNGDYFLVTLENFAAREICKCTARVGDVLTIERAQEGTTSSVFPIGSSIQARVTEHALDRFQEATEKQYPVDFVYNLPQPVSAKASSVVFTSDTDDGGMPIQAIKSGTLWKFPSHPHAVVSGTVLSSSSTSVMDTGAFSNLVYAGGRYLIQITSGPMAGYVRKLSTVSANSVSWVNELPYPPSTGDTYQVYVSVSSRLKDLDDRINFLTKGDFGVGSNSILTEDFNTISATGFYHNSSGSAVGIPASGRVFTVVHVNLSAGSATQYATDTYSSTADQRVFVRTKSAGTWGSWNEVWTSENLAKQSSTTDTTAGALMGVGAFGLGGSSTVAVPGGSLDTLSVTGFYFVNANAGTHPAGHTVGELLHFERGSSNQATQIYDALRGAGLGQALFCRTRRSDGTWSSWSELWHSGNLKQQSSVSDTTAGALLMAGAFGLGGNVLEVTSGDILDTTRPSGLYHFTSAVSNLPVSGAGTTALVLNRTSGTEVAVLAMPNTGGSSAGFGRIYINRFGSAAWSGWRELLNSSSQLAIGATAASARTALELGTAALDTSATWSSANTVVKRDASGNIAVAKATAMGGTETPWIELRSSGGTPYIDFSNDGYADFDARLILSSDNLLDVTGASLRLADSWASIQFAGPHATYNYGLLQDSNGNANLSRFTKDGAWSTTIAYWDASCNMTNVGNLTVNGKVYGHLGILDYRGVSTGAVTEIGGTVRHFFQNGSEMGIPFGGTGDYYIVEDAYGWYAGGDAYKTRYQVAHGGNGAGGGRIFVRYANGTSWGTWRFLVDNSSPNLMVGSCTFSGNGGITVLKNTGLSISRDAVGVYGIAPIFGFGAANTPITVMTNDASAIPVMTVGATQGGGAQFGIYRNGTGFVDCGYVCVLIGSSSS